MFGLFNIDLGEDCAGQHANDHSYAVELRCFAGGTKSFDMPSRLQWLFNENINGERSNAMDKQLKSPMLIGMIVLLLSACGPVGTAPTLEPVVSQIPVESPAVSVVGLAPEKYSKYVGIEYPPRPSGLSEELGMLIQGSEDYGLSLVSDGENKMLWLSQLTHHDELGNAYWQVRDILDLSAVEDGANLVPDGCMLNGTPDSEIFAVGKDGKILQAWRANTALNVFQVLASDGIECNSDKAVEL